MARELKTRYVSFVAKIGANMNGSACTCVCTENVKRYTAAGRPVNNEPINEPANTRQYDGRSEVIFMPGLDNPGQEPGDE